jgi:anti-sigma regulatory factor (Ser/Thr protein kinase)
VLQARSRLPLDRPDPERAERVIARSFPAVPESLGPLRDAVTRFAEAAGAGSETLEAIRLVSSEAAANAIEHAYDPGSGEVHLTAIHGPGAIWVVVADDGRGLRIHPGRPSAGFGFAWMARFSDAMTVEPAPNGGVEVSFRFRV